MENKPPERTPIWRNGGPGPFGFILILLGIILLAQRLGSFSFANWWALFILIPALTSVGTAFSMWQRDGKLHYGVFSTLYGGLFPLLIAVIFLFGLSWEDYWPLFVILGGFGMLLSGLPFSRPDEVKVPGALLHHRPWAFFLGLAATLLGLTFLGQTLEIYDFTALIPFDNWWGLFPLIASLGGFGTAFALFTGRSSTYLVLMSLAGGAVLALVGIIAILNLDWQLLDMAAPILLILAGVGLLAGLGRRNRE